MERRQPLTESQALQAEGRMTQAGLDAFAKPAMEQSHELLPMSKSSFPSFRTAEIKEFKKNKGAWALLSRSFLQATGAK